MRGVRYLQIVGSPWIASVAFGIDWPSRFGNEAPRNAFMSSMIAITRVRLILFNEDIE
jgi:hypothetical protein